MKKILLFTIVFNFISCTNDNDDNYTKTINHVVGERRQQFNSNPTPEDYEKIGNSNFMKDLEDLKNLRNVNTSHTSKTTAESWIRSTTPDPAFRAKLISIGAGREDGVIGDNYIEINANLTYLDISNAGITDITGLANFKKLIQLNCSFNEIPVLPTSRMPLLQILECQNNKITGIDITKLKELRQLWAQNNLLTTVDFPEAPNLWGVWLYGNQINQLNVHSWGSQYGWEAQNTAITELFIQDNLLTTFDFTSLINLSQTNVSSNRFITLNFDSNTKLKSLWCYSNSSLIDLSIKNGFNSNIYGQDFSSNIKAPKIHVDASFLPIANTAWPLKGSSTYIL